MKDHRSLSTLAVILLSACFNPTPPPGGPCDTDGWCPPPLECIEQVCRLPGYVPPDAALPDAFPADNADLTVLSLSVAAPLEPTFASNIQDYELQVSKLVRSLRVTASPAHREATLMIDGSPATAGVPSLPIPVTPGTPVAITVTAPASAMKRYKVNVDSDFPPAQYVYAKADNVDADDIFGWRVVIDGDTMAVSAPGEASCDSGVHLTAKSDDGCPGRGAVYVYGRSGSDWNLEAYLKPFEASDVSTDDEFGIGLALDGDTIVVGAFREDSVEPDSGAAYVFHRNGNVWSEDKRLKPLQPQAGQEFGWSVAVAGDVIAVGARLEDHGGTTNSGAVHLFHRGTSGWETDERLTALIPETDGFFGYSVAASAGVVVVGACGHGCPSIGKDDPQTGGNAYVFRRSETEGWTQEVDLATLVSPGPEPGDAFGLSVALSEDGDTVVIGAPYEDSNSTTINQGQGDNSAVESGAAYVFRRSGTTWTPEAYLKATNTDTKDEFGYGVAIAGTLVAVGATRDEKGDAESGAVYLYSRNVRTWSVLDDASASNFGEDDHFGWCLALSDDALVVSAPFEDSSRTGIPEDLGGDDNDRRNSGAVYLFH